MQRDEVKERVYQVIAKVLKIDTAQIEERDRKSVV